MHPQGLCVILLQAERKWEKDKKAATRKWASRKQEAEAEILKKQILSAIGFATAGLYMYKALR